MYCCLKLHVSFGKYNLRWVEHPDTQNKDKNFCLPINSLDLSFLCIPEVNKDVNKSCATYIWNRGKNWQRSTIGGGRIWGSGGDDNLSFKLNWPNACAYVYDKKKSCCIYRIQQNKSDVSYSLKKKKPWFSVRFCREKKKVYSSSSRKHAYLCVISQRDNGGFFYLTFSRIYLISTNLDIWVAEWLKYQFPIHNCVNKYSNIIWLTSFIYFSWHKVM
jgi:hypothetical protein